PLPTTGTPGGPGFFGKGFINAVQQLKYFGIMQKVMVHCRSPFLGRKVTRPQQARLFKLFEVVYPQPLTLRDHQRIQSHQYL
ncbi:hypothetical protein HAP94_25100, partial [Acidithiobacillus ferrivorans]|nr:hypothetical protein [Acidithiobacillus ferrivorans]MBU2769345.1 hypothetical protein [Acidithiobacillus ferrivorans]